MDNILCLSCREHQHWSSDSPQIEPQDCNKIWGNSVEFWKCDELVSECRHPALYLDFYLKSTAVQHEASYSKPYQQRAIDYIKPHKAAAWTKKCWLWRKTAGQKQEIWKLTCTGHLCPPHSESHQPQSKKTQHRKTNQPINQKGDNRWCHILVSFNSSAHSDDFD